MNFGDKLYHLRRKNGFSQEELGEKLNVTRQTISKWELGQSKPDTDKLMELSKLLNVDFNQLADDNIKIETTINVSNSNCEELKPRRWLLVVLVIIAIAIVIILANKFVTDRKSKSENSYGIFNIFSNLIEQQMKESPNDFNFSFEMYSGTTSGFFLIDLIDEVITNNKTNKEHIITVLFNDINTIDPNTIKDLKKNINDSSSSEYEISLDYDENGFVNKITIEESKKIDKFEINRFNSSFELYSGSEYGLSVVRLLEDVITNNKTNSEHIIKVIYGNINTFNETEIRNLKKTFNDWTKYEVILEYDEIGFVSQVTIEN